MLAERRTPQGGCWFSGLRAPWGALEGLLWLEQIHHHLRQPRDCGPRHTASHLLKRSSGPAGHFLCSQSQESYRPLRKEAAVVRQLGWRADRDEEWPHLHQMPSTTVRVAEDPTLSMPGERHPHCQRVHLTTEHTLNRTTLKGGQLASRGHCKGTKGEATAPADPEVATKGSVTVSSGKLLQEDRFSFSPL